MQATKLLSYGPIKCQGLRHFLEVFVQSKQLHSPGSLRQQREEPCGICRSCPLPPTPPPSVIDFLQTSTEPGLRGAVLVRKMGSDLVPSVYWMLFFSSRPTLDSAGS